MTRELAAKQTIRTQCPVVGARPTATSSVSPARAHEAVRQRRFNAKTLMKELWKQPNPTKR